MKISRNEAENDNQHIMLNNIQSIETVNNFIYLGSMITNDYDDSSEIRRRLSLAKSAMISLTNIWKDIEMSVTTKKRLNAGSGQKQIKGELIVLDCGIPVGFYESAGLKRLLTKVY